MFGLHIRVGGTHSHSTNLPGTRWHRTIATTAAHCGQSKDIPGTDDCGLG